MPPTRTFTNDDVRNYYDHTQVHYRRFWKLEQSMGLHYGVWDEHTRSLAGAIVNTNARLARLGNIQPGDLVLDAGCGVGGSSIFLAKNIGCRCVGITLSQRQVNSARNYASRHGVNDLLHFEVMDYTHTDFPARYFDVVWAIESMQTAHDKSLFFEEAARLLKPGGRLLIADVFKAGNWHLDDTPQMQTMLHGWAMSDILNLEELVRLLEKHHFALVGSSNVSAEIAPSVRRIYRASLAGMLGTELYNLFHRATHFSRVHYKSGIAQYKTWKRGLWEYHLLCGRLADTLP